MGNYYGEENWNWKLRVAFLVIIGHLVVLILPLFSVIFLLMDILGEGLYPGRIHIFGNSGYHAIAEGVLLVFLMATVFFQMIVVSVFPSAFKKLVFAEIGFLTGFTFFSWGSWGGFSLPIVPLLVLFLCSGLKLSHVLCGQKLDQAKHVFLRRSGKVV